MATSKRSGTRRLSAEPWERGPLAHVLSLQSGIMALLDPHVPVGETVGNVVAALKHATGFDAVGLRLAEDDDYPFIAATGYSDDFLREENTPTVSMECTCGLVLGGKTDPADPLFTSGGSAWTNDSLQLLEAPAEQDPREHPRNQCIHVGFRSIALVPLRAGDEILGLLHLADRRMDRFTPETMQLFEGIAAGTGMALRSRHSEKALRESEAKLRFTFDEAPVGVVSVGLDHRFLSLNETFCDFLGYSEEELKKRTTAEVTHPDDAEIGTADMRAILAGDKKSAHVQKRYVRKDGTVVWGEVNIGLIRDDAGKPMYFLTVIQDITQRAESEAKLNSMQQLLIETERIGNVGGWEFDIDTGAQTWTEEIYRIHEVDRDYVPTVEKGIGFYTPASRQTVERAVQRAVEGGEPFDVELQIITAKGNRRDVRAIGRADLERRRVQGFFQDVTDRTQAEEERLRLERQVQQDRRLESLGVLAGGIAHDFNNILTSILGNAELALAELPASIPGRDSLREIVEASRRAAALAQQMLAYSGRGGDVDEAIELGGLVHGMIGLLQSTISRRARLDIDLAADLPLINGDSSQICRLMMNLIVNASEALGQKDGVITVSAHAKECSAEYLGHRVPGQDLTPGLYLVLRVADTGAGMDAETRARLFEPFFTTKFAGRGLGLSAVLGVVRGHRGAIAVDSVEGKGATFTILLPAVPAEEGARPGPRAPDQAEWLGWGTALLVDDEETIRAMGARMLARLGFAVLTAADGAEALSVYAEHRGEISVVLLDLTMPRLSGEETFRGLRALDPEVRVVMSSGYTEQDIASLFADGRPPAGFVQKPYTLVELRERLRMALEEAEPGSALW